MSDILTRAQIDEIALRNADDLDWTLSAQYCTDIAALLTHVDALAAENARLREAARKAGAALLMAHAARTKDEQQMTAEAREYVLFTVYPAAGIDCTGEVWDKESANG